MRWKNERNTHGWGKEGGARESREIKFIIFDVEQEKQQVWEQKNNE